MSSTTEAGPGVRSEVNYLHNPVAPGEPPLTFVTENEEKSTMVVLPGASVWINNMRGQTTSLDVEGFELIKHKSAVPDFHLIEESPEVDQLYIQEMTDLVKKVTGATYVVMQGGGKKRYGRAAQDRLTGLKNALPALYVHGDTTDTSALQLAQMMSQFIPDFEFSQAKRWAHINMWRAITPPPHDYPLAVCDARTIAEADKHLVVAETETRVGGAFAFHTHGFIKNPAHRWCYFKDMTLDEVLFFKTHDSDPTRPRQVAHTAFVNPECPPGAPTRGSVEMRALVIFD